MTIKLGVVMDAIANIHFEKDSTLAMLLEAQARDYEIYYFEQSNLFVRDGVAYGAARKLRVINDATRWYEFLGEQVLPLADLSIILMRKDPPFNKEYIYTTYILELAEHQGVLVANKPQSLRDCNEKFFATHFPQYAPPTLVAQNKQDLLAFWREHHDIVCKPLDGMGGSQVFHLRENDVNANAVFDLLTRQEKLYVIAQTFIPDIVSGDKRIIMIDGEPVPHALARKPQGSEWRGNLALGAKGVVQPLSDRDRLICDTVGPELKKRGLYFVGLDVIGDYLTEINVTSPTCIREIDKDANTNISAQLLDCLAGKL